MYYVAEEQKYVIKEIAFNRRSRADVLMVMITNFMFYLKK